MGGRPYCPSMEVLRDGCAYVIAEQSEVDWLAGTPRSNTIESAIPLRFEAYATFYSPDQDDEPTHERAVVRVLTQHTAPQPWWLGFLDTGAHDVVFPGARRVRLYQDWPYVVVKAGPVEALSWRVGHVRSSGGALPDLFYPADRSWVVSALWDDTWGCIGGPQALIDALVQEPDAGACQVTTREDMLPEGLERD